MSVQPGACSARRVRPSAELQFPAGGSQCQSTSLSERLPAPAGCIQPTYKPSRRKHAPFCEAWDLKSSGSRDTATLYRINSGTKTPNKTVNADHSPRGGFPQNARNLGVGM